MTVKKELLDQAQAELQRSEKRLRDIIDGLGPSVFVGLMTPQGILIEANRSALAAAGLKLEDVLGQPFADSYWWAYSPDVQQQLRDAIARAVRGEASRYDARVRAAEGQFIDVDFSLQPSRDEAGEVVFLVPSAVVITERKRAENAWRETDERFHQLADNISDIFWIRSPDMRELYYVSPALEQIWGISATSLYERPEQWANYIYPEDRERVLGEFGGFTGDGAHVDIEYRIVRPDGLLRWVHTRGFQVRDAAGELTRLIGIVTDITARKLAEEAQRRSTAALVESEARFRQIAEAIREVFFLTDPQMSEMFYVSPAYEEIFGRTCESLYANPRSWGDTMHPDDQGRVFAQLAPQGTLIPFDVEYRTLRPDGSVRAIRARGFPIHDGAGAVSRFAGIAEDITERTNAEAELRSAKEGAEAANRAKSEFLANMSHEIRTPMNGVIGMTELVLDTDLTSEQREHMEIVRSSANSLLAVINDILDFSRMEAGKLELDATDFSPRDVIGATASAVALSAHEKGLELIVDVDDAVPRLLHGDAGRLRQILVNLLGNAVKFTSHGEVELRVTTDAPTSSGVVVHVSVRDTGVGIPADRQARVFQAFTQVDGSVTREYGGTGLGLTISSQLVALMGGRIWMDSAPGRGSTFHFTVSLAMANHAELPALADAVDLRGLSVLVVDDNATNRRLLEVMLTGWHMVPTLVASVSEALAALRVAQAAGRPFALVVTDVQMPKADGFALASAIRREPPIAGALIIMLTSVGQPGDAAQRRTLRIAGYLPKPVRRSELHRTILAVLGDHSAGQNRQALIAGSSAPKAHCAGRVLLVEDNSVNQLVARRLLEKRGYTVVVADDGKHALAILDDAAIARFGCVLMDVQMPEMGGFECTGIIRERERASGAHLPIIAMTAHAMDGDAVRCLAAGMDSYLSKPVTPDALFNLVERYLGAEPPGPLPTSPSFLG